MKYLRFYIRFLKLFPDLGLLSLITGRVKFLLILEFRICVILLRLFKLIRILILRFLISLLRITEFRICRILLRFFQYIRLYGDICVLKDFLFSFFSFLPDPLLDLFFDGLSKVILIILVQGRLCYSILKLTEKLIFLCSGVEIPDPSLQ